MVGEAGPPSAPQSPALVELEVTEEEAGTRLDKVLAARDLGWSRTVLARWIDEGRVEVEGSVVLRKYRVRAGDEILVRPAPPLPSDALPQDIPLCILHEDEHVVVLDKPAGLVVHPAPGHPDGTLVNALLFHVPHLSDVGAGRPGIVHRLDKDTSGIMVVACTDLAREGLTAQFRDHSIERRYRAITVGVPPAKVSYRTLHGRHPVHRRRFSSQVDRGKRAVTHLKRLRVLAGAALVECRLETGRTHQIRVHLADAGFALLGDPVYGPGAPGALGQVAAALGRQALHAAELGFVHPDTGRSMSFVAEPPPDFGRALRALEPG